ARSTLHPTSPCCRRPSTSKQIVQKVMQGSVDLHRLEQALGGDCDRAVRLRRQALERLR
ncbi:unnamed protein product, partial [Hapterophycus canaliculatus]